MNRQTENLHLQRELLTPEGIPLHLQLAGAGERAAAFLIDAFIIVLVLIILSLASFFASLSTTPEIMEVVWLLGFFVLRNFYFSFFEIGARAATPGKRLLGLRVTARNGGRLRANAVIARNAMRELEIFLPLSFLFASGASGVDGWLILLGLIWSGLFLFFPMFNRDRLRIGDFIAGTWVIQIPKIKLQTDMSDHNVSGVGFDFNSKQLSAYGIHELQVLEKVLRLKKPEAIASVAERIRTKIKWIKQKKENDLDFLNAYYSGLRKTLESKLLFGVRRKDKYHKV
ncbi:MAG: RDD family protein [Robiginitomaculum sp.]|nr:RDD family protein [Robiginitomaculum sp.]